MSPGYAGHWDEKGGRGKESKDSVCLCNTAQIQERGLVEKISKEKISKLTAGLNIPADFLKDKDKE